MEIHISENENHINITVGGVLDTETSCDFHEKIKRLDLHDVHKVVLDFENLSYLSSTGLREILMLRKRLSGKEQLHIINANEDVISIFRMTGFDDIVTISGAQRDGGEKYLTFSFKELLDYKAAHRKDHVIFIDENETYSWGDFNKCVQIVTMDLYKLGVRKGSHVAICAQNSVNWMITFWAIQKLGAIALFLNFALRENEISDLCRNGDVDYFCYGDLPGSDDPALLKDHLLSHKDLSLKGTYFMGKSRQYKTRFGEYEEIKYFFDEKVMADLPAVIIFSSGSTGRPKGVILSAYNVLNASLNHGKALQVCEQDRVCMILPLFHIFGLAAGVLSTILANGSVYFPENRKTDTILSAIEKQRCTIFYSVPTMMLALVNNRNFHSDKVACLRSCTLSGAAVSESQVYMLQERFPTTHFTCAYGLSEFAPATITDYNDPIEKIAKTVGKPVKGVELKIQGADGPGQTGEILLKGINLMTGYYRLPIEDQAIDEDGWLHTGDLGRVDENGYLQIVGRIKELIIRGGENIIPGEVASAISKHDMISDVKVTGVPDDFFGEVVAAAIVLKKDRRFDETALNDFLAGQIAEYKIPVFYHIYEEFPTMPNGKTDAMRIKKEMTDKAKNRSTGNR